MAGRMSGKDWRQVAREWRTAHGGHVANLMRIGPSGADHVYPPSGSDVIRPELWSGAHWRWFAQSEGEALTEQARKKPFRVWMRINIVILALFAVFSIYDLWHPHAAILIAFNAAIFGMASLLAGFITRGIPLP